MKYLGIDYGTKRIGIAISDDEGRVAFPLMTVPAGPKALSGIVELAKKNRVQKFVVGESRNFKGTPNPVMEDIEQFKKDLEELSGLPVAYRDDFLTSPAAGRQSSQEKKTRQVAPSQEKLDAAAAALILQSYLDKNRDTI